MGQLPRTARSTSALLAALVGLAAFATAASGAAVVVDTPDDPAAPDCAAGHAAGTCSLRGAVAAAAADDTVTIAAGVNPTLTAGEIAISSNLTIEGQGARATVVSGSDASRIFFVSGGLINIRRLALTHGLATGGGAIYDDVVGSVVLEDVAVTRNSVVAPGAAIAYGGGIINRGTLTLSRVTVANNSAEGGGGAGGGGIANGGTFTATNSTISDNSATGHGAFSVTGGGVYNFASTTLINATVASNTVTATGAGAGSGGNITVVGGGANATLKNTLVAYGTAPGGANCLNGGAGSTFTSQGGNLEATAPSQCGLSGPPGSDLIGVDPLLGPLADNGGQTDTRALGDGSPALDAVVTANCPEPTEDQRLVARPQGSLCDVGAFERAAVGGPPAAGPAGPSTSAPPSSPTPQTTGPTVTGPAGNPLGLPSNRKCVDRRKFSFRLHHPAATKIVDVLVFINGKRTRHLRARAINRITLTRLPQKKFQVKIVATQDSGGQLISVRTYKGCKKSKPRTRRGHSHR